MTIDSRYSGKDQASASQFWKMSRQLPWKLSCGAPFASRRAIWKLFHGRRRVAVPAAERQRQVLQREAHQVDVAAGPGPVQELADRQPGRQLGQEAGAARGRRRAALPDEGPDVAGLDAVAVDRHPAAHHVEQHVGQMVGGRELVTGGLQAVRGRDDPLEVGAVGRQVGLEQPRQLGGSREQVAQGDDVGGVLLDVADDAPRPLLPGARASRACTR